MHFVHFNDQCVSLVATSAISVLFATGCADTGETSITMSGAQPATQHNMNGYLEMTDEVHSTPVCGKDGEQVEGQRWAPCAALDQTCSRGVFDMEQHCCFVEILPAGSGCTGGICGKNGECIPDLDRDHDDVPDEQDPVIGSYSWIDTNGPAAGIWYADGSLELRLDGKKVAVLPTDNSLDLSLVKLRQPPRDHELTALWIESPTVVREIWLTEGSDKPASDAVCFVTANQRDAVKLATDCSDPVSQRIECPGNFDDFRCRIEDSFRVLSGPDIEFAWLPIHGIVADVRFLEGLIPLDCPLAMVS